MELCGMWLMSNIALKLFLAIGLESTSKGELQASLMAVSSKSALGESVCHISGGNGMSSSGTP